MMTRRALLGWWAVHAHVGLVVGFVLGDRGVALAVPATTPHEEEEDEGGDEDDAAGDADSEADFEACVGGGA